MKRNSVKGYSLNKYRQSLSTISSQLALGSFSYQQSPINFKENDEKVSILRNNIRCDLADFLRQEFQSYLVEREKEKTSYLRQTLIELEEKISVAKNKLLSGKSIGVLSDSDDQTTVKSYQNEKKLTFSGESISTVSSHGRNRNLFSPPSRNRVTPFSPKKTVLQPLKTKNQYYNQHFTLKEKQDLRSLQHLNFSLKVFKNQSRIIVPTIAQIEQKKIYLPRSKQHQGKKTLIIDIDQTLIHCQQDASKPYDIVLPIEVQNGSTANAYITIRPYAISFLKRMSKQYEIIAFTASHESYADPVLDQLDPERKYISHRLYRKNCIEVYQNIFAKDLRIINRQLSSMVLVDNAPYSYLLQLQNGIPILPYYTGEDTELVHLEKYLEEMGRFSDVREFNKGHFQLHRYVECNDAEEVVKQLIERKRVL